MGVLTLHEGHRNRLRKKLEKVGPDVLESHELLELILFYIIPVRNTNDIAHRLLDRFGSFKEICAASIKDLCLVEGVGEKTALFLKTYGYVHSRMLQEETPIKKASIEDSDIVLNLVKARLSCLTDERLLLILADRQKRINFCNIIFNGTLETINIQPKEIIEISSSNNAKFAIIAHNHPSGVALPSSKDLETTHQIKQALRLIGVNLLDHFIVTTNDCISLHEHKMM